MTLLVSWVTQPLRLPFSRSPVFSFRVVALNNTFRILLSPVAPLGLCCVWCMPRAINMPPLWG